MAIEQPFDEPWQARAFALTVNLHDRGLFVWSEWTEVLAAEIAADPCQSYYDAWLAALQILASDRAGLSSTEIDRALADWLLAAAHTPHGEPITLDAIPVAPHVH